MTSGTVNIRLRPIRIAFLVDPADRHGILEAISINSFLWGGRHNPIIPAYTGTPRRWADGPMKAPSARTIVEGYLKAFDPDFVAPIGDRTAEAYDLGGRRVIPSAAILEEVEEDGTPRFGIGMFEILNFFVETELKFERRKPLRIVFPQPAQRYEPFMAALYGCLPERLKEAALRRFDDTMAVETPGASIGNYLNWFNADTVFPLRLATHGIEAVGGAGTERTVFFMDASSTLDVLDFWNLRALGWRVLPVPKQRADDQIVRQRVVDLIERAHRPMRHNPEIYTRATVMKSRSTTAGEVEAFARSLNVPVGPDGSKYVLQHWYPRIWDDWARDKDGVGGVRLEAGSVEHDVVSDASNLTLRTVDPPFAFRFGGHGEPRFANEIRYRLYGQDPLPADVIPQGDERFVHAIGGMGLREWRSSATALVYLSNHVDWQVRAPTPDARAIWSAWLTAKGMKNVTSSAAGRIAHQMVKHLGGTIGISTLAMEGIVKLLTQDLGAPKQRRDDDLTGSPEDNMRTVNYEDLRGKVLRILNPSDGVRPDPDRLIERLIEANMVRLGISTKCSVCGQSSWYSIDGFTYVVRCPKCLAEFSIPAHAPKEMKWAYRSFGPFSLTGSSYGAYSVLLCLRFFEHLLHGAITPFAGFEAEIDGREIETDLGLFFQESRFGKSRTETIFAECKSFNRFEKRDTERMRFLGSRFPTATLVFATLNKSLTSDEKRLLSPIVNQCRRARAAGRPSNTILLLTGTELFADLGPPHCWQDVDGPRRRFENAYLRLDEGLADLCDVTQQLYLDMDSWHDWHESRSD